MEEICDSCVYLEADREIINEHIEKEMALEAQIKEFKAENKDLRGDLDAECRVSQMLLAGNGKLQERIKALEAEDGKCKWAYDDNYDMWETECGEAFCLESGGPIDNKMKYCPYCGKQLVQTLKGK